NSGNQRPGQGFSIGLTPSSEPNFKRHLSPERKMSWRRKHCYQCASPSMLSALTAWVKGELYPRFKPTREPQERARQKLASKASKRRTMANLKRQCQQHSPTSTHF